MMKAVYLVKRFTSYLLLLIFAILLNLRMAMAEEPVQPSPQEKGLPEVGVEPGGRSPEVSALGGQPGKRLVSIDFDNVDIRLVIKLVSEWTGNNYLIDDQIKGNVTIISPTRIPIEQAVMVMESILEVKGFSTVPAGNVIKIIPAADAKGKAITTYVGKDMEKVSLNDRFITQIVPLQYADAGEVRTLLASLMSKNSSMFAHLPSNTLIITDIASNVHRLMEILKIIDVESKQAILTVIPLKHSQSTVIANQLSTMIQAKQQAVKGRIPVRIASDDRTNSLVILTPPEEMESLKELIEKLDIPTPPGTSTVHVYKLKNSEAAKLAPTLTNVFKTQQLRTTGQQVAVEQPNIVADDVTNSLIITASPQDYEGIEAMLQKLDVMRRQVLVEALIAEVSIDKSLELGIEWQSIEEPVEGSERVIGDIIYDTDNVTLAQSMAAKQGLAIGLMKGSISGIPTIGVLLHAFQKDASVNILSTPHLLCLDNESAKIIISDNVPYITSSTSLIPTTETTTSTPTVVSSYGFKDIGITLEIKPYIGEESVRLHIQQEVSQLNEGLSLAGQPATIKRQADTNVIAGNGETIVIGGLVRDDKSKGIEKVPLLGDIPLLGLAFRRSKNVIKKTNLLIFLSPHIITTPEDANIITEKKKQESDEFIKGKAKDKKLKKKKEEKKSDGDKR